MANVASLPEAALSLGSRIGRYFGLVSMLPAVLLVIFILALSKTGAWSGSPDLGAAVRELRDSSLGDLAMVLLVSLVVALLLHPLQFPFTQLLEGYWGTSSLAGSVATERISGYRSRFWRLEDLEDTSLTYLARVSLELPDSPDGRSKAAEKLGNEPHETVNRIIDWGNSKAGNERTSIDAYRLYEAAARAKGGLPQGCLRCMPTRLGNVLRRYEDLAGDRYGLDSIALVPRLAVIAPAEHTAYLQDSRESLDLAIRMCLVSALASAAAAAALATDGLWLLASLLPLGAAYLSYLGAVAAAHEYGTALCVLVDLNRFALYERLRLPQPETLDIERSANPLLCRVIGGPSVSRAEAATVAFTDPQGTTPEARTGASASDDA